MASDQAPSRSSGSRQLPARPRIEYLKKLAKERLRTMRAAAPDAQLAEAQLLVARERDAEGLTPMHWVTRTDSNDPREVEAARLLLDAGADPDARDPGGMTPLHTAAEWPSSIALAALLIERGASIDATIHTWHWTPLDYAIDRNREAMRDFLRGRGAKTRHELSVADDAAVDAFLALVQGGDVEAVRTHLDEAPALANRARKHPVWADARRRCTSRSSAATGRCSTCCWTATRSPRARTRCTTTGRR